MNKNNLHFEGTQGGQILLQNIYKEDPQAEKVLRAFYDEFTPKAAAQGLPPHAKDVRDHWISDILHNGTNIVASLNGGIVGHAAIVGFEQRECEYLVFVYRDHQGKGIGSALTHACIDLADELGYERVWLSVESDNRRAISIYLKAGFKYVGTTYDEMELKLPLDRKASPPASAQIPVWSAVIPFMVVCQTMQYTQLRFMLNLVRLSRERQAALESNFRKFFFSRTLASFYGRPPTTGRKDRF